MRRRLPPCSNALSCRHTEWMAASLGPRSGQHSTVQMAMRSGCAANRTFRSQGAIWLSSNRPGEVGMATLPEVLDEENHDKRNRNGKAIIMHRRDFLRSG